MKKHWLVVVDDDVMSLRNAKNLLNGDQVRVSAVRSGQDLLIFLRKNIPDLILLDVMMPEMDGFETYRRLRAYEEQEGRSHTPVIFLTGEDDSETEHRGLNLGADDFIRKPINRDILFKRIQNTIENRETIASLTEEAATDHLTGFLNKVSAEDRMTELCRKGHGILMVLDLDNFKLINDLYGHEAGDRVLEGFAAITRQNSRAEDVLCRIGGDEFLVFLQGTTEEVAVAAFVKRLNDRIVAECKAMMGEDFRIPVGVSVGCVPVPEQGGDYRSLFRLADKALYQVKQNGKHDYRFYDLGTEGDVQGKEDPERELARMVTLCEERGEVRNAIRVGQETFIWIYRYIDRFAKRHRNAFTRMIIDLSPEGDTAPEDFARAVERFETLLRRNLRMNDVILQSGSSRFFALLPELEEANVPVVIRRILERWRETPEHGCARIGHAASSRAYGDAKGTERPPQEAACAEEGAGMKGRASDERIGGQ